MHRIEVLENAKQAFVEEDSGRLNALSDQTIHSASTEQHTDIIATAVFIYALSKILERKSKLKIKNWNEFVKKINSYLSLAITALIEGKNDIYLEHIERARKVMTSISVNLKPYIQDVFRKASINKASKIYEHGISLGQTSKLLGITEWELSEYSGQSNLSENEYNSTLTTKKRAEMAMEFFS